MVNYFKVSSTNDLAGSSTTRSAPCFLAPVNFWGISVFGFASVLVAPAPLIFIFYGESIRERFKIEF